MIFCQLLLWKAYMKLYNFIFLCQVQRDFGKPSTFAFRYIRIVESRAFVRMVSEAQRAWAFLAAGWEGSWNMQEQPNVWGLLGISTGGLGINRGKERRRKTRGHRDHNSGRGAMSVWCQPTEGHGPAQLFRDKTRPIWIQFQNHLKLLECVDIGS